MVKTNINKDKEFMFQRVRRKCISKKHLNTTQAASDIRNKCFNDLYNAVINNEDINVITAYVRQGVNLQTVDKFNQTLLHIAVERENLSVVKTLVFNGAFVNNLDKFGRTPLQIALATGNVAIITNLLKNGADPNYISHTQKSFLYNQILKGDKVVVTLLLQYGADPNSLCYFEEPTDKQLSTLTSLNILFGALVPLRVRRTTVLLEAIRLRQLDIVELLLNYGADANGKDASATTPMEYAIMKNDMDTVRLLAKYRANVKGWNQYKVNYLHLAVCNDNVEMVQLMLEHGADPNCKTAEENMPLHFATCRAGVAVTEILLNYGADANAMNNLKHSPIEYAIRYKKLDVVELLLEYGVDINMQFFKSTLEGIVRNNFSDFDVIEDIFFAHYMKLKVLKVSNNKRLEQYLIKSWGKVKFNKVYVDGGKEVQLMKSDQVTSDKLNSSLITFMKTPWAKLKAYNNPHLQNANYKKYPMFAGMIQRRLKYVTTLHRSRNRTYNFDDETVQSSVLF